MKRIIAPVIAGIVLTLTILTATPANAVDRHRDTRACVTQREANGAHEPYTKRELENRWDVTGEGVAVEWFGFIIVTYPRCGYPFDPELSTPGSAWTGAIYRKDHTLKVVMWAKEAWLDQPGADTVSRGV